MANESQQTPRLGSRFSRVRARQRKYTTQGVTARMGLVGGSVGNPYTRQPEIPENDPVPRDTPVLVQEDEIFKISCYHEVYTYAARSELNNMPKFDDVTAYGKTSAREKELWQLEIRRLIHVVTHPDEAVLFPGADAHGQSENPADVYETLSCLAEQILNFLFIIIADNQVIYLENCKEYYNEDDMRKSIKMLKLSLADEEDGQDRRLATLYQKKCAPEDLFGVVDFVTAAVTRFLSRSAYGAVWVNNCIAVLAKLSTKLKVLSEKPIAFTEMALDTTSDALNSFNSQQSRKKGRQKRSTMSEGATRLKQLKMMSGGHEDSDEEDDDDQYTSSVHGLKRIYFRHHAKFRTSIYSILRYTLVFLRGQNDIYALPVTSFEISSVVYETGSDRSSTLVHQDRDEEFTASSDPDCLNIAHSAFEILHQAVKQIKSAQPSTATPAPPISGGSRALSNSRINTPASQPALATSIDTHTPLSRGNGTTVEWRYSKYDRPSQARTRSAASPSNTHLHGKSTLSPTPAEGLHAHEEKEELKLTTMPEIVTVLVLLTLASPVVVSRTESFVDMTMFTSDPMEITLPFQPERFGAVFCMYTTEYEVTRRRRVSGATSLSKSLMAEGRLLVGERIGDTLDTLTDAEARKKASKKREYTAASKRRMELANRKMEKWIYDEMGVMVKCPLYVWTVIVTCVVLVSGGIAIGVSVGPRVSAVDPFNITTYCWVIAAFIVLIAKSIRVGSWPWRDFLLRQVLCSSVSELHAVSGIEEQLILATLLQNDGSTVLRTRGPYNAAFNNTTEDGTGFSIDRPTAMSTLLLNGLIMLKVATPRGGALVCLDARRGTKLVGVFHNHVCPEEREEKHLVSVGLDNGLQLNEKSTPGECLPLKKNRMEWTRVLGLYNNRDCYFQ